MKCPVCPDVDLAMTDRQGIEIDYCPKCRGIWLDRGELDRLIERAERSEQAAAPPPPPPPPAYDTRYPPREHYGEHAHHGHHKKHRKSMLGELFDF